MYGRCSLVLILLASTMRGYTQRDEQVWLDFQVSYPFGNRYLLENVTTYQTVMNPENKWRNIGISPTFEYNLFRWVDLLSELPLTYTQQKDDVSSFEVTPLVGMRFFITQNRRIDTRFVLRYQSRFYRLIEDEEWQVSNRTRLRGEAFICINGPNLFTDKLWYSFLDYEEYLVLDKQLDERYANRRRGRVGIGYRLSYKHRFELSYTLQSSRNEIDEGFIANDNVIQVRYKMYLNPAKPTTGPDQ